MGDRAGITVLDVDPAENAEPDLHQARRLEAAHGFPDPLAAHAEALGLYMRLRLEESPVQRAELEAGIVARLPVKDVFSKHLKRTLLAVGVFTGPFALQAISSTFAVSFATTFAGVSHQVTINLMIIIQAVIVIFIPFFAWLSDRFGRKTVYVPAVSLMIVTAFLLFPAIKTGSITLIAVIYAGHLGVLHSAAVGTIGALLSEQFPTKIRYTGTAVAYQGSALLRWRDRTAPRRHDRRGRTGHSRAGCGHGRWHGAECPLCTRASGDPQGRTRHGEGLTFAVATARPGTAPGRAVRLPVHLQASP